MHCGSPHWTKFGGLWRHCPRVAVPGTRFFGTNSLISGNVFVIWCTECVVRARVGVAFVCISYAGTLLLVCRLCLCDDNVTAVHSDRFAVNADENPLSSTPAPKLPEGRVIALVHVDAPFCCIFRWFASFMLSLLFDFWPIGGFWVVWRNSTVYYFSSSSSAWIKCQRFFCLCYLTEINW